MCILEVLIVLGSEHFLDKVFFFSTFMQSAENCNSFF